MHFSTILFLFSFILSQDDLLTKLNGKWDLEKTEREKHITTIAKGYYIHFSGTSVSYNKDVNSCRADISRITNDTLELTNSACTEMCCDGARDPMFKQLNYSGKYTVNDTVLTIENNGMKLYFKKRTNFIK